MATHAAAKPKSEQKKSGPSKPLEPNKKKALRAYDVERDSFDFRDLIYRPGLQELAAALLPDWKCLQVLDQKREGACCGFGLAAVVNYQNAQAGIKARVSARMLFEMGKRYDQWPGHRYDYTSARGAMKGWHKHGVCTDTAWPNHPNPGDNILTWERQQDALKFVLGAYYRILGRRSDVHAALMEAGVVFASADTHDGWDHVDAKGVIPFTPSDPKGGGHAFAIVGYTQEGFLILNSWGNDWGGWRDAKGRAHPGVALWQYADFDQNVWDLWVARKALPVESIAALSGGRYVAGPAGTRVSEDAPPAQEIWNHYVHIDDGQFDPKGDYPSSARETQAIASRLVRLGGNDGKAPQHILLYAHGGLNTVAGSAQRVRQMQKVFGQNGIASLHFIWETGMFAELRDVLLGKEKFAEQRVARGSSWWDKFIEGAVKPLGVPLWTEMREDAELAFAAGDSAGNVTLAALAQALLDAGSKAPRLHLVAHSAGSILFGHLLRDALAALAQPPQIEQLVLFAPACTTDFFRQAILPSLERGAVKAMHHFYLDDKTEQDDNVAQVYRKSLLYLVSNALQDRRRAGVPLLGMEVFWKEIFEDLPLALRKRITAYNPRDNGHKTNSRAHGGFDNDVATMNSLLELVLGKKPAVPFTEKDVQGY